MTERYVVAGLARGRRDWFSNVARWATAGVSPIEFVKCLTADEVRALLGAGRRLSALLVDSATPGLDRDLVELATSMGCPTIVVSDGRAHRDWEAIGCAAVIADDFGPDELFDVLASSARPIDHDVQRVGRVRLSTDDEGRQGQVIAVVGSGGVGTSTVSMIAAQAMARLGRSTVLVDGARRSHHAMLHDLGDVMPGLPELVESHRSDRLAPEQVASLTFDIATRDYSLLLGLRRTHDWTAMRRRSIDAALDALARTYETTVVDIDSDLDGEALTGSADVGDRHGVTASTLAMAALVLLVGQHDLKGLAAVERLYGELIDAGVSPQRCVVVFNQADRSPARRALATRSLATLIGAAPSATSAPLFVRRIRNLDDLHHRCAPLPSSTVDRFGRAVLHALDSVPAPSEASGPELGEPEPITAGSLGISRTVPRDAA